MNDDFHASGKNNLKKVLLGDLPEAEAAEAGSSAEFSSSSFKGKLLKSRR